MANLKPGDVVETGGEKFLLIPLSPWLHDRIRLEMGELKKMGLDRVSGRELGRAILEQYFHQVDEIDEHLADSEPWGIGWK